MGTGTENQGCLYRVDLVLCYWPLCRLSQGVWGLLADVKLPTKHHAELGGFGLKTHKLILLVCFSTLGFSFFFLL